MNWPADPIPWFYSLPAVGALASVVLLLWAWRGRRVDDHPLCRRCGFDLVGRPETSTACAECGADLGRRRAIRIGHRRPRRGVVAVALPLVLACAAWLGAVGYGRARGVEWVRHKPLWMLQRQAGGANAPARDAAVAEMARRLAAGSLAPAVEEKLEEQALALQADLTRTWVPAWGELLEASRNAGRLSDAQWERYVAQSVALSLEVRPKVRRGDPLPVRVKWGPTRVGKASFGLILTLDSGVRVGGEPASLWPENTQAPRRFNVGPAPGPGGQGVYAEGLCDLGGKPLAALADAKHTLRVTGRVKTLANTRGGQTLNGQGTEIALERPFELVPANVPTVRVSNDPAHREAVEAALQLYGMQYAPGRHEPARLSGYLDCSAPPVALCYDLSVRVGFSRLPCGNLMLLPQGQGGRWPVATVVPGPPLEARSVEVVLTPDPARAARTVDVTEIWGEPVVFRDVPVLEANAE